MATEIVGLSRPGWSGWTSSAGATTGVLAAMLCLDGQLWALSVTLQRAVALAVLVALAPFTIVRAGGWQVVSWAGAVGTWRC